MELKQIETSDRINFLREFTIELIYSIVKKNQVSENIQAEKIKQKFIKPAVSQEEIFEKINKSSAFKPSGYEIETIKMPEAEQAKTTELPGFKPSIIEQTGIESAKTTKAKPEIKKEAVEIKKPEPQIPASPPRKPTFYLATPPKPTAAQVLQKMRPQARQTAQIQKQILSSIKPVAMQKPTGMKLGKLDQLLRDPLIQSIECPGAGQNLLIKKYNKINSTQITLTKEEMEDIITTFSMQARIPVVGGVLKAAVGDLLINAIVSNVVESRFVISRIAAVQRTPIMMR